MLRLRTRCIEKRSTVEKSTMVSFPFLFRSPQRDKGTDQARLSSIQNAVRAAVASANNELSGLQARLENARRSAASLLGNDVDGSDREPAHETKLRSVEERLLAAEERVQRLIEHLETLKRIEDAFNAELES
jgi:hypothetical protein